MNRLRELVQDLRTILWVADPSSKFITYFGLLDAFKQAGCPVCTRLEQGALRALDSLLYEQVNDPATRDRLIDSHGFCNWHAWMLPSVRNSASGVAIIYRHLLQETLDHLQSAERDTHPRSRWQRLRERLTGFHGEPLSFLARRSKKARCYMCNFSRQLERDDLKTILEFIGEVEFSEAFARSSGLCLPHLYASMAVGRDHPNLRTLVAAHEARWKDLVWELEEFSRKFDYRYADEPKGRESSSWHRALDVFVGRSGVFGSERGDGPANLALETPAAASVEGGSPQTQVTDAERLAENQSLRFEVEKLRRRIEELLARQAEDRETRLALEFQVLKLMSDLRAMAVELAAVNQGKPTPFESRSADDEPTVQEGGESH